ncbi:hypothetical protein L208DRAFT_1421976 [Tricholoma matsutake]|nr:hypothetical protein L208DRAFT_1421976 [Tricholoma matsutake 945]
MDKTKSKLAAFFDNDEEESSFPQKAVDDAKVSQYTAGKVKKSRREKEQEAAEAKKREEEANAAKAYAEFLDAFEGEDVGKKNAASNFVKASGEAGAAYTAARGQPERQSRASGAAHVLNRSSSPPSTAPKPKGKRAMDAFLEEIKKEQAEREARYSRHTHGHGRSVTAMAAYEGQSGSKDRGDPQTSNVFVANLPPHVTEQSLGNFFARAGPVGSVKVMWPRTDGTVGPGADMTASRRTRNAGLSGFVSFMKRKDAEKALREFDGFDWGGSILRVGWSKAVPIAAKPLYVSEPGKEERSRSSSRSRSRSRERRRSRSRSPTRKHHGNRYRSSSWGRNRSNSPRRRRSYSRSRRHDEFGRRSPRRHRSRSPQNRGHLEEDEVVTDTFIRAVAGEIKGHDAKFEETLRGREKNNPKFAFIFRKDHRRHAYYRGLIESNQTLDPEFDDEEKSERERVRKNTLGKLARRRFESMLRALSGKRGEIARCMAFSLEHAEAAHEVVDIIVASLLVDGTPVPRKVARLHLICDILHNSAASVPSAWKFRLEFQSRLGIVFDHLAGIYHSFPGRITAETFKKQITSVVDIWEDWIVFTPDFTSELRMRLDGVTKDVGSKPDDIPEVGQKSVEEYSSRFKASSFQLATGPADGKVQLPDREDEKPMDVASDVDGEPVDNINKHLDDVDGEPVDDVDGEPVDVDGDPVDGDVDGIPVADEDMDGLPMDDLDGEAMDEDGA